jgi:hypothetical protein
MMPRLATRDLGYPLNLLGQYADLDMGFDSSRGPVVHRRHLDLGALERAEAAFDDPFAIVFGGIRYRSPVDMQLTALGGSQIAFEAAGSKQVYGPLGVGRMIFVAGQFKLGVITKDVAAPSLSVAKDNLLGLKVVLESGVWTTLAEHFPLNLGIGGHTAGQKVFATRLGQPNPIVRRVHARISDSRKLSLTERIGYL